MKRYIYVYDTFVSFSSPVVNHSFLLRCQPVLGEYMRVEEEHLLMASEFGIRRSCDQWGSRIVYGGTRDAHVSLSYVSTGILSMSPYSVKADVGSMVVWRLPTHLTYVAESELEALLAGNPHPSEADAVGAATFICHQVHELLTYAPATTTVCTMASEVLQLRQGVCQDYAHVMIALCRAHGMAARYVCGFMEGTGETHAWVEVFDGYRWLGFDPTHDRQVEYGYVKLAHGRDAADCPVSRGLYVGNVHEETCVHVMLREI